MTAILLLALGLVFLIVGSDWLVKGASGLAKRYQVPDIVIGLTIVSFGTSMPELLVSFLAAIQGNSAIALGNVLGSNIVNIWFILGVSAMIFPLVAKRNTTWIEIPIALMSAVLLGFLAYLGYNEAEDSAHLSRFSGIILLTGFAGFMWYIIRLAKKGKEGIIQSEDFVPMNGGKAILFILAGIATMGLGGKWCVDNAVLLAKTWGVSDALIGLTIVAVGTSLPELATSAMAAYKKETDIAIGNVVGSNIFNILWILGVSATISPMKFGTNMNFDFAMAIASALMLFMFMFIGKRHQLDRWKGFLFVLTYAAYVIYLIQRG